MLLFVRLNAVLQSPYDLLNNHNVSIVIEHSSSLPPRFSWSASFSDKTRRCNPNFVKITLSKLLFSLRLYLAEPKQVGPT